MGSDELRGRLNWQTSSGSLSILAEQNFFDILNKLLNNRLKEVRSDFCGADLPCGEFNANMVYLLLASIAYNLLVLMRMKLSRK